MSPQTAFGGMLRHFGELTSLVLRPEPLDAETERRCKQAWEEAPCPECGDSAVQTGDDSPRVWYRLPIRVHLHAQHPVRRMHATPGEIVITGAPLHGLLDCFVVNVFR